MLVPEDIEAACSNGGGYSEHKAIDDHVRAFLPEKKGQNLPMGGVEMHAPYRPIHLF